MQQGRRTASLKASYEAAINAGFTNMYGFGSSSVPPSHESSISQELQSLSNPSSISGYGIDSSLSSNKSGRTTKRTRTSHYLDSGSASGSLTLHNSNFDDESSDAIITEEHPPNMEWFDPNEPRYCICNHVSYGDMVACDNEDVGYICFNNLNKLLI